MSDSDRQSLAQALLAKLPEFDLTWSDALKDSWFTAHSVLIPSQRAPTTNPQQEMMLSLARNLRDWSSDLRKATNSSEYMNRLITIGRLEGLALGLNAIAAIAADAAEPERGEGSGG